MVLAMLDNEGVVQMEWGCSRRSNLHTNRTDNVVVIETCPQCAACCGDE